MAADLVHILSLPSEEAAPKLEALALALQSQASFPDLTTAAKKVTHPSSQLALKGIPRETGVALLGEAWLTVLAK